LLVESRPGIAGPLFFQSFYPKDKIPSAAKATL
jgi:hypothetical protein